MKSVLALIGQTTINVKLMMRLQQMDAYLEEELYDALTYTIQNPNAFGSIFKLKLQL